MVPEGRGGQCAIARPAQVSSTARPTDFIMEFTCFFEQPVFSDFVASVEYAECHLLFRQNRNGGDGDGELTKDLRNVYNGLAQVQWCDIARYHYSATRWD